MVTAEWDGGDDNDWYTNGNDDANDDYFGDDRTASGDDECYIGQGPDPDCVAAGNAPASCPIVQRMHCD